MRFGCYAGFLKIVNIHKVLIIIHSPSGELVADINNALRIIKRLVLLGVCRKRQRDRVYEKGRDRDF